MADVVVTFKSDAEQLKRDLDDVESKSSMASGALTALAAGLVSAAGAAAALAQKTADAINDINDMSSRTGVAAKNLRGLALAAEGSGLKLDDLEGALARVTANGLKIEDVVKELQGIEDPTERAAKAMELAGKQGGKLIQVLGDQSIKDFADFAETYGYETGPEASKAAAEFQRNVAALKETLGGLLDAATGLPAVNKAVRGLAIGTVFVKELALALQEVDGSTDDIFAAAIERTRVYWEDLNRVTQGIDAAGESWEEFRIRQELGLEDAPLIEFKQGAEDVSKATKKAAEDVEAFNKHVDGVIQFKSALGELGYEFVYGVTPAIGVAIPPMGRVVGLLTETDEAAEKAKKSLKDVFANPQIKAGAESLSVVIGHAVDFSDALTESFEAFGVKSEKAMKAAFVASKAFAISDVVVKTALSIMNAFATLPTPAAVVAAPLIGATGALQAATIAAQQFGQGGTAGGGASLGGLSGGAAIQGAAAATQGGVTKVPTGPSPRTMFRENAVAYRHRDLDVVARDGRVYPGGAFDFGGSTGQARYERG